jgi:hypothetical protein
VKQTEVLAQVIMFNNQYLDHIFAYSIPLLLFCVTTPLLYDCLLHVSSTEKIACYI